MFREKISLSEFYERTKAEKRTDAESAAIVIDLRNHGLSECDWTQMPDTPLDDATRAKWQQYRQALRDITDQPGFPREIEWPTPPDETEAE